MKGLFAPLITAVALIDALTHNPVQYFNTAEETGVAPLNAEPSNIPQPDVVNQNVPTNEQDVEPLNTEVEASKHDISEQPDGVDELDSDEEKVDTKPTPSEFADANETPKPTPGTKLDFVDDDLNKPAGIDFPMGEPAEKEFDRVEIATTTSYTTSTVYSTVTSTVTDCVATVTDCPEKGSVVTKTISLYTTICPVTTPTSVAPPSDKLDHEDPDSPELDAPNSDEPESEIPDTESPETEIPDAESPETEIPDTESPETELETELEQDTESDSDIPDAPEPTPKPTPEPYLTKTVETTVWYTVTDCEPKETDCPVGQETSSVSTRTEIYPVTDIPHFLSPNSTQAQPYATGSPSSYPEPPYTNVTVPTTPPNFTINAGSAQKANGLLMGFGLVAASVIAFMQGWY